MIIILLYNTCVLSAWPLSCMEAPLYIMNNWEVWSLGGCHVCAYALHGLVAVASLAGRLLLLCIQNSNQPYN